MESKQLVDALTDHIAFYHSLSSSSSNPNPNPNSNPRNPLLRWFSSLSPAERQQTLTIFDPKFVRVLLQMRSRLDCNGHGSFFLLPDLPSSSDPSLPSLCFRRSRGLLSRAGNPRDFLVSDSLLLFGSRNDEELDSVTVDDAFVSDIDRFVEVMDVVSNGRFLRGEEKALELDKEWAELEWLKDNGYYSLEAFSANRLEVALRLAWRASGRGGRKGKGGGNGVAASVSASALWRRKGCVDWWAGLDLKQREDVCTGFLGKTAKCLANGIVKVPNIALKNRFSFSNIDSEMPLKFGPNASGQTPEMFFRRDSDFCLDLTPSSGMPHYFAKLLNKLLIVQEISAILLACQLNKVEKEQLFFSRLGVALTVADLIMRKLRGVIMLVSIEHINQELLGDENLKTLPQKAEGKKLNASYRKGKRKPRNSKILDSLPKPSKVNSTRQEPSMNSERKSDHLKDRSLCHQADALSLTDSQKKGIFNDYVLPKDRGEGHTVDLLDYKGHADKKKNEGKRAKPKKPSSKEVVFPNKNKKIIVPSVSAETKKAECVELADTSMSQPISSDLAVEVDLSPIFDEVVSSIEKMKDGNQVEYAPFFADKCSSGKERTPVSNELKNGVINHVVPCVANDERSKQTISSRPSVTRSSVIIDKQIDITCSRSTSCCDNTGFPLPTWEIESAMVQNENEHPIFTGQRTLLSILPEPSHAPVKENTVGIQSDHSGRYIYNHLSPMGGMSYEWPNITPSTLTSVSTLHLPTTTDRLHLEVGHKCQHRFQQSLLSRHQARNSSVEGGQSRILPSLIPMSYDWPPMVKNCGRLSQTATVSYDSAFNPPLRPSFCSGVAAHAGHGVPVNGTYSESDKKEPGDSFDLYNMKSSSELVDDPESYWLSEEETETHVVFGRDYNQFFGGGVMYWNPVEHVAGFSRPPSHSSEDSSWAWYEADLNRAIDDMVGMPGLPTSYNTTGMASPPAAPFCSPFDPLGSGHQQIGYPLPGNDVGNVLHSSSTSDVPEEHASISLNSSPGGVEGAKGDLLPYARLRPIIAPSVSRNGSRSEFKLTHGHKSPCLPSTRRDHPRIKRPPSPVVLCVPQVPRPPPPSPVGESRRRGYPIVRSGSSSPRHCGMRSRSNEDGNCEDPRLCLEGVEVVWPSWGTKGLVGTPVAKSVHGSLLQDHLITISQLTRNQEHPDIVLPVQPPDILNSPHKASLSLMHNILHEEIDFFCKQVAAENMIRKPYINWAIKRVARSLQVLWPRSRTSIFGSNATGLALPTSDVDLVVSLPPVQNLEPIKEAGILEGRNGIKETRLQHAARYLANQEWVINDSLKTIENTAIPLIMLVAEVPHDIICSKGTSSIGETPEVRPTLISTADASSHPTTDHTSLPICSKNGNDNASSVTSLRLDISFKSTSHTGLQTSELVRELTQQFPASVPLALILKIFLADRNLDHAYSGGLSSYCLILLIIRFLQHEHHMGRPIDHNLGSLLMDFLYFFGNVFDPRQMRISIQGSGVYVKRERGLSIDPIHIDDPLFPSNNVGRNCFRIHQCVKAFADAYSLLENELSYFSSNYAPDSKAEFTLLRKIIPSIDSG